MLSCTDARELFGLLLDGELEEPVALEVREHLAGCEDCAGLYEAMEQVSDSGAWLAGAKPPEHLAADLQASPCRRWLGLLFQAVDREISQPNLERLLSHMESCPSCLAAWQDLTLIHQVGEATEPPAHLLKHCIAAREGRRLMRPILSRRMATAAAYVLAVFTSVIIGNPVTLARNPTVERVTQAVTAEVAEAADQGRGEARMMLWRAWKWGGERLEAVRGLLTKDAENATENNEDTPQERDQGETS